MTKLEKSVVRRATEATIDGKPMIVELAPGDKLVLRALRGRREIVHKLQNLVDEGEDSADLVRSVTRRTTETYWKDKKIVVQLGPGDIIKFRYEGDRDWMESSVAGAMQHAAALKADRDKVHKKVERDGKYLAKRGMLR